MQVTKLEVKNWCQHSSRVVEFKPGLNGILGDNGSGKSNLLSAIAFALTGAATSFGSKGDNLRYGTKSGWVELSFKHEGHSYVVKRAIEKASQSLTGPGVELTKTAEIEQFLTKLLSATPAVLLNNVFATQGEIDRILYTPPSARLKEFQSTFGLMRAEQCYKALGQELQSIKTTPGLQDLITTTAQHMHAAKKELAAHDDKQQSLQDTIAELSPSRDIVARALAAVRGRDLVAQARKRLADANADFVSAQTLLSNSEPAYKIAQAALPDISQQLADMRQDKATYDSVSSRLSTIKLKIMSCSSPAEPDGVAPTQEELLALQQAFVSSESTFKQASDAASGVTPRPRLKDEQEARDRLSDLKRQLTMIVVPDDMAQAHMDARATLRDLESHKSQFTNGICPTCKQAVDGGPEHAAQLQEQISAAKKALDEVVAANGRWMEETKSAIRKEISAVESSIARFEEAWSKLCQRKLQDATAKHAAAKQTLDDAVEVSRQWEEYHRKNEERQTLKNEEIDLLARLDGMTFTPAALSTLAVKEKTLQQTIDNYAQIVRDLAAAQSELTKATDFLAGIANTVDEPTPEELTKAKEDVTKLAEAESMLRDISVMKGTMQGKLQMLETELVTLKKQQESEAADAAWGEIVTKARQTLHVSELPAAVMADYSNRLNARIQHYLTGWESEFSMSLDSELAFKVRFPDKEHDAARLSGGQKIVASTSFRFAMADLFAKQVGLLVLDEPSTALDATKVVHLQRLLVKLKEMAGHGDRQIIIVTHEVSLMGFLEHVVEL